MVIKKILRAARKYYDAKLETLHHVKAVRRKESRSNKIPHNTKTFMDCSDGLAKDLFKNVSEMLSLKLFDLSDHLAALINSKPIKEELLKDLTGNTRMSKILILRDKNNELLYHSYNKTVLSQYLESVENALLLENFLELSILHLRNNLQP